MSSIAFAWRSLVRQPGRAVLGVLGVAAVGALLFDMLLLSRGLVVSLADQLDRVGFDVRVTAGDAFQVGGYRIQDASAVVDMVSAVPEVEAVTSIRIDEGWALWPGRRVRLTFVGSTPGPNTGWRIVEGADLHEATGPLPPVVVSRSVLADSTRVAAPMGIGHTLALRGDCLDGRSALPRIEFEIVGIAEFPIYGRARNMAAVAPDRLAEICGELNTDEADFLLVASRPENGPQEAARTVADAVPELHAFSNQELVDEFQQIGFSYFRQISTVLATVTLFFGFLLISTLLTVSVNQRVAEIATMRAMGFPRRRIVTDLGFESAMLVGAGGLLALPMGGVLAVILDGILRSMPGFPPELHFFVYEHRAVGLHAGLLSATAVLAALYPARLATRLPIASTLRDEVVS
jgi:putative ABC transport system permease protein